MTSTTGAPDAADPTGATEPPEPTGPTGRTAPTANWTAFSVAEPDLATTVEERFTAFTHHTLATLRRDGSPRTSGLEVRFLHGELWLGMMPDSYKALDLRRDPRFALQANPGPGTTMAGGDVRISGRAYEDADPAAKAAYVKEVEPPQPFHLFRTELTEVVRTYVEDDTYLVVEIWKPGEPVRALRRT
ncbi:pyridoxamine 5'-phosphate oxidase family protein [Streptomyces sp. NPDC127072]|uniref:pyridoxamine 5'-phosphate oxidase family protein n=1 Tax=Streptomyces sp. NPDC127072 TaxID=3347129 RepID=UPI00364B133B